MALTDTKIRTIKPKEKAYKLADEKGLFLLINPTGSKCWRFKYRFNAKEKLLSLGIYPDLSLADARDKRDEARKLLAKEIDPGLAKQTAKRSGRIAAENSFEAIGREWHLKVSPQWDPNHAKTILRRLEKDVFPWLGKRPIAEITSLELLSVLRRIESRGAAEATRKIYQSCGQIFRYAIATGRAERNPAPDLKGALQPVRKRHFASITDPQEIGKLLNGCQ
jgi:hypothetical protein